MPAATPEQVEKALDELESLWIRDGGDPELARLMACAALWHYVSRGQGKAVVRLFRFAPVMRFIAQARRNPEFWDGLDLEKFLEPIDWSTTAASRSW